MRAQSGSILLSDVILKCTHLVYVQDGTGVRGTRVSIVYSRYQQQQQKQPHLPLELIFLPA